MDPKLELALNEFLFELLISLASFQPSHTIFIHESVKEAAVGTSVGPQGASMDVDRSKTCTELIRILRPIRTKHVYDRS